MNNRIDDFRNKNTISTYLFGILIRDKLKISVGEFPRLYKGDCAYKRNFLHFWSSTCLYRDIGYEIENKSNEYIKGKK